MSGGRLAPAAQLRYMLEWFQEWSELQRQDFLPLLVDKLAGEQAAHIDALVNSMAGVNCENKPMSLFQCRIKLFNEWYPTWGEEERSRLVAGVTNVDAEFGEKMQQALETARNPVLNGDGNGVSDDDTNTETEPASVTPTERVAREPDVQEPEEIPEPVQESTMPLEIVATS